jgi:hypothetical protein
MTLKDSIAITDMAIRALEQPKYEHWCQYCEEPLGQGEFDIVELPADQGCAGATTLIRIECGYCSKECEPYRGQDRE